MKKPIDLGDRIDNAFKYNFYIKLDSMRYTNLNHMCVTKIRDELSHIIAVNIGFRLGNVIENMKLEKLN